MSSPAQRRLLKDLQKIQKQQDQGINASLIDNNLMHWQAIIQGAPKTSWQGGFFELSLTFPEEYPNKAPNVVFTTPMFHPNIYPDGRICLDILQNQWSSVYDASAVLTSIRAMLGDPNPLSPANNEAAQIYCEDMSEYERRVREVVERSNEMDEE